MSEIVLNHSVLNLIWEPAGGFADVSDFNNYNSEFIWESVWYSAWAPTVNSVFKAIKGE